LPAFARKSERLLGRTLGDRVSAQRYASLVTQGAVSRQENDVYQAQYHAQTASVNALEKAIAAQRSNVAAAEANLSRLESMSGYRLVKAPFAGVITLRNVDVGALVTTGSTLLFRIAQMDTLRIYVNVPQSNASFIRQGQAASLRVSNLPGRTFAGAIARTATAEEKPALWQKMVGVYPDYADYQRKTEREIPIVILDPVK